MRKYIILIVSLLLISSCGQKKARTQFDLKVASIATGLPLPGGVTLRAVPLLAGAESAAFQTIDMVGPDHFADLDFGNWNLYFVAFAGPSVWQGTTYCGSVSNLALSTPDLILNVDLTSANCGVEPYISIIASKQVSNISTWDSAIWDSSVWEP